MEFSYNRFDLLIFLLGLLVFLIVLITVLLKVKRKSSKQEKIPGVEEMAKTLFFWSDYHKGRIGEDEKDE